MLLLFISSYFQYFFLHFQQLLKIQKRLALVTPTGAPMIAANDALETL